MVEPPCCGDALRLTIILSKFFVFCIFKGFWKYKLQFKKVFKKRRRKEREKEEKKRERERKKGENIRVE